MAPSNQSRQVNGGSRSARGRTRPYAALDLGTNNCRLLIAEPTRGGKLRVIDSYSHVVRLGEGLAQTGELSQPAMDRAMTALDACLKKVQSHKPAQSKFIATQACRAATNGDVFLKAVREQVGLKLETISPKQEAKYALLGSLDLVDNNAHFAAVIDIGGGSTEICWIDARAARSRGVKGCAARAPILGWASFPFGVVTLAETFPAGQPSDYQALVQYVRDQMKDHDAASRFGPLFEAGRGQLIGNSGTVTSLTAVSLGLSKYHRSTVDGTWLPRTTAEEITSRLVNATVEERAAEPCIGPDRTDLIVSGCAILEAIWSLWPAEKMRVGDRGLREGILLSMIHGPKRTNRKRQRPKPKD